jgi:hypothetical protein
MTTRSLLLTTGIGREQHATNRRSRVVTVTTSGNWFCVRDQVGAVAKAVDLHYFHAAD